MGRGFFGRGRFGMEERAKMFELWQKMTTEEKVEMIDKKKGTMKHMEEHMKDFFHHIERNFGEKSQKWEGMSYDEKVSFIQQKEEAMKNCKGPHGHIFGGKGFSVEAMDKFCEAWLKKTPEEKASAIKEREEMFHHRSCGMGSFFGYRGFGE